MSGRDLKLNSLQGSREAPGLVLEEHGSCEVPAGCGGVVLRWRRRADLPLEMWLYNAAPADVFLDGVPLASARPLIPIGTHVLAFRLREVRSPGQTLIMFAAFHYERRSMRGGMGPADGPRYVLTSDADGLWKYDGTAAEGDDWIKPDFDDSAWSPMIATALPHEEDGTMAAHRLQRILELGGKPLGAPAVASDVIRIRRAFTFEPTADRSPDDV